MTAWSPFLGVEASADGEDPGASSGRGDPAPAPALTQSLAPAPWRAAETRLYPLITADPELYETAVTLVREALEVLRTRCGSVSELALVPPSEVVDHCPSAHTAAASGIDPGTALDAARAARWRELTVDGPGGAPAPIADGRP